MDLKGAPLEINVKSSVQNILPSQQLMWDQNPEDGQGRLHFVLFLSQFIKRSHKSQMVTQSNLSSWHNNQVGTISHQCIQIDYLHCWWRLISSVFAEDRKWKTDKLSRTSTPNGRRIHDKLFNSAYKTPLATSIKLLRGASLFYKIKFVNTVIIK